MICQKPSEDVSIDGSIWAIKSSDMKKANSPCYFSINFYIRTYIILNFLNPFNRSLY